MLNASSSSNQVVTDNNRQGFLRRPGKTRKSLALRRKRWYKLDGAIFSKHSNESSEASWYVNIQGADIVQLEKTHFVLVLRVPEGGDSVNDFEQNTLLLYAKTEEDCKAWVCSLRYAAQRRLENHYNIGQLIGEGGFARVRLGTCVLSGELRAIKTMRKNDAHAKLFGTEIAIIKRVSHPNIVKTFDVYETSTHIHIVMEYMEGGMLYDAIEDGVRFNEQDTAQFMRELLDAILYLHSCGIVHRDIKPENVLCTSKNTPLHVKIADFGLSSMGSITGIKENQMIMSTMIGTPEFIAPEIARRQEYTEKVDMWALGMLCYNVICGQLPMDEKEDMICQIKNGIVLNFPEPEWKRYSGYSRSFVKALLCTDPQKRLSPLASLVHPWLELMKLEDSNKVGAHGRVSMFLLQQDPYAVFRNNKFSNQSSSAISTRFRSRADVKRWWKIAILSVRAAGRFDFLVNPDRYNDYTIKTQSKNTASSERTASEWTTSEGIDSGRKSQYSHSKESSFNDFDFAVCGSDNGDEAISSPSLATASHERDMRLSEKQMQCFEQNSRSFEDNVLVRNPHSWGVCRNVLDSSLVQDSEKDDPAGMRKLTLRKKILKALSPETENGLARKLSFKLSKIGNGEEKRRNSVVRSPLDRNAFDLDLEDLELTKAEETEIDLQNDMEMSGPSSWFGKKHKALLKLSGKRSGFLSPLSPHHQTGEPSSLTVLHRTKDSKADQQR